MSVFPNCFRYITGRFFLDQNCRKTILQVSIVLRLYQHNALKNIQSNEKFKIVLEKKKFKVKLNFDEDIFD